MDKSILEMEWYLLGHPWCHSRDSGLTILAGSNDPHKAVAIADTMDLLGEKYDDDVGRDIAKHIVDLHNASLKAEYSLIQIVETLNGLDHRVSIGQAFNSSQLDMLRQQARKYDTEPGELKLLKKTIEEIAL